MKSIKTFFLTVTIIIAVIIFTFQAGLSFISLSQITYKTVEENLKTYAEKEAAFLNMNFHEIGKNSRDLSILIASMERMDNDLIFSLIKKILKESKMVYGGGFWMEPFIVDKKTKYYGPYIYKNDQENLELTWDYSIEEYNYFQHDWYKNNFNSDGNIVFSEPFYDRVSGITMMTISSPIDRNGSIIGVATFDVGLKELQDYVENIKIGEEGYAYIVTREGYYWAYSNCGENLKSKITYDSNPELKQFGEDVLNTNHTDIREVDENYMVYTPIGNTGLKLITVMPVNEAVKNIRDVFLFNISSFIMSLIIFAIAFSYIFQKKIIHPMNIMAKSSQMLSEGDTTEISDLAYYSKLNNEIGLLSRVQIKLRQTMINNYYLQNQLQMHAYFDALTGLRNRKSFTSELEEGCSEINKNHSTGALFFIDIDNFKTINDTYGHPFGDKLLVRIAHRLTELISNNRDYTIARFGGDEFAVLAKQNKDMNTIAKNLVKLFSEAFEVEGNTIYLSCSIGIAVYPCDGCQSEDLLKKADIAMYKVKSQGKNGYLFYNEWMGEEIKYKTEIEKDLRFAIPNNEFELFYQPQVDVITGEIVGVEALIRWHSSENGMVMPNQFIHIAEENGSIISIGKWVFDKACEFAIRINENSLKPIIISVNVSYLELSQDSFVENIMDTINKYDIEPSMLGFEVTESILIKSFKTIVDKLSYLKEMGFNISIDDFGTGYSSLSYLKKLPLNFVKIDRDFIKDIQYEEKEQNIIKPIISLAQGMGLKVIVEGVETEEQYAYLKESKCDYFQGYWMSKPLPENEIIEIILKNNNGKI